jgi:hypothetical protein
MIGVAGMVHAGRLPGTNPANFLERPRMTSLVGCQQFLASFVVCLNGPSPGKLVQRECSSAGLQDTKESGDEEELIQREADLGVVEGDRSGGSAIRSLPRKPG